MNYGHSTFFGRISGSHDTPFHIAAYDGDIDAVKIMLPYVNDMNLKGDIGNTPLHYAISSRQLPMVEMLIYSGANLGQGNDYGDTPLSYMEGDELFSQVLRERQHPGATLGEKR